MLTLIPDPAYVAGSPEYDVGDAAGDDYELGEAYYHEEADYDLGDVNQADYELQDAAVEERDYDLGEANHEADYALGDLKPEVVYQFYADEAPYMAGLLLDLL